MDSCISKGIKSHVLKEAFKNEGSDRCTDIFEKSIRSFNEDVKEFLMNTVGERIDEFDVTKTYDLDCYLFLVDKGTE